MRVIISTLRAREFDLSFDARMDARNDLLLWGAKVRRRVGFGDGGGEALLTDRVASPGAATHRIDDWRQLLAAAGIALDEPSPRLSVNAHERAEGAERLRALGLDPDSPIVAVHAGASDARKQWGIERFDAVSRGVGRVAQVVAFEDPRAPRNAPLGNAPTLRLPLREYMSTVAACSAYVGNDSGATHVAAALGVPVVAIFGATRPEWFAPVGESHRVLSASGVRCDRCGDLCTHAVPAAFDAVSIDTVVEAVLSRLPVRASAT
jgi:ADP-heptose:LPS heptosyltransferase